LVEKCKSHNYITTQKGKFVCTECGHVRISTRKTKRLVKIFSILVICAVVSAGFYYANTNGMTQKFLMFVSEKISNVSQQIQKNPSPAINQSNSKTSQNPKMDSSVSTQSSYHNSVWPCSMKSDVSGNINVDCYEQGSYSFKNPLVENITLDEVKLVWNDSGNYKIISSDSQERDFDLGKLIIKEKTNTPRPVESTSLNVTNSQFSTIAEKCSVVSNGSGYLKWYCGTYVAGSYTILSLKGDEGYPFYEARPYTIDPIKIIPKGNSYVIEFSTPSGTPVIHDLLPYVDQKGEINIDAKIIDRIQISFLDAMKSFDANSFYGINQVSQQQPNMSSILKSTNNDNNTVIVPIPNIPVTQSQPTLSELYNYALKIVNSDRTANGLAPVELSDIKSGQDHADDQLNNDYFSHWNTNGVKPYVTYTKLGGRGSVAENIDYSHSTCPTNNCIQHNYDPYEQIKVAEDDMMNHDAASNWGHKKNILDPNHTHVNFGISYDHERFYFVENFEDRIITWQKINLNGDQLLLLGTMSSGYSISQIRVFKDPTPQVLTGEQLTNESPYNLGFYNQGDLVGMVVPKPQDNSSYAECSQGKLKTTLSDGTSDCIDYTTFTNNPNSVNSINMIVDMSKWIGKGGLHTIYLDLKDKSGNDVLATSLTLEYLK